MWVLWGWILAKLEFGERKGRGVDVTIVSLLLAVSLGYIDSALVVVVGLPRWIVIVFADVIGCGDGDRVVLLLLSKRMYRNILTKRGS